MFFLKKMCKSQFCQVFVVIALEMEQTSRWWYDQDPETKQNQTEKRVDPGRFNRRKRKKLEERGRKNLGDLAVASSGSKKTQGASGSR